MIKQKNKKLNSDYFISVISVLSNDSDIFVPFLKETVSVLSSTYENYEFVLVDNDSKDNTRTIMDKLLREHDCIRYIRLSRQFDVETAISAGLDTVIGDIIVILEPECDPPKLIPYMVEKVKETNGVVFGIKKNRSAILPLYYRIGKVLFHQLSRIFLEFYPPKDAGFFIGLSRQSLNALIQIKDRSKFLRIFSSEIGYQTKKFNYDMILRRKKPRKKTFFDSLNYAISAIVTNSTMPLRFVGYLGFFAASLNVIYMFYVFLIAFFKKNVMEGWITTSLQSSIMFFFLFMILAVSSEYLIRVINENSDRPSYYIAGEKNSSVMISNKSKKRNVYKEPVR